MRIYLDHNATTPVRDEVAEAVLRVLRDVWGNPSSAHAEGSAARAEVESARERVAALVAAKPAEVVFTGGATESNNLAIFGVARAPGVSGRHLVTSAAEHPSVEAPLAALEAEGFRVTRVPVDADGLLDPDAVAAALTPETSLVSILWANNETGVVQPVARIAERAARARRAAARRRDPGGRQDRGAARRKCPPICSRLRRTSSTGRRALVSWSCAARALSCRGCGADRRSAAVAAARTTCRASRDSASPRNWRTASWTSAPCAARRCAIVLWSGIEAKVPRVRRNGAAVRVLPNTLCVEFRDTAGDVLLEALDGEGVAVSAGAACASGSVQPSRTLLAMGRTPAEARASLRFSVGHGVDEAQIERVLALLPDLVARVRSLGCAR